MTIAGQQKSISTKSEFIKTIDALFLKMELAYHYQFYKVFGTDEKLREGKKLWALSLKNIHPDTIIQAVENVISSQSYLPTLTDLLKACKDNYLIVLRLNFVCLNPKEVYFEGYLKSLESLFQSY